MKWTYYLSYKVKIALALTVVFALVILTNIADRNYFSTLHASFASVYEDRLMVEGYIFELSNILHNRHLRILNAGAPDATNVPHPSDKEITRLLTVYEKTVFTEAEDTAFQQLKTELAALQALENEFARQQDQGLLTQLAAKHAALGILLNALSNIQIEEGRNQINQSEKIVASSYFLSRVEIIVIIVAGLAVQILVMSSKSIASRFPQDGRLN